MAKGKGMKRPDEFQGSSVPANGHYITHGDLLALATKRHCQGIVTKPVLALCRPEKNFWVFKATVYKSPKCRGFVGYGDAHPGNVSPLIFNHALARPTASPSVRSKIFLPAPCRLSRSLCCAAPSSLDRPFRKKRLVDTLGLEQLTKYPAWVIRQARCISMRMQLGIAVISNFAVN
jgi:hypothetical protein